MDLNEYLEHRTEESALPIAEDEQCFCSKHFNKVNHDCLSGCHYEDKG